MSDRETSGSYFRDSATLKWVFLAIRRARFKNPQTEFPSDVLKKMGAPPVREEKKNGSAKRIVLVNRPERPVSLLTRLRGFFSRL